MAYSNYFPTSYPNYPSYVYPQAPVQTPVQQPQPQQNVGIIWVQGEAGAKSYLVAPNNTVQLWDSESQTIYLKSADASGMPSMKVIDYTIRDAVSQTPTPTIPIDYPTRKEFDALKTQVNDLKQELGMKEESYESAL